MKAGNSSLSIHDATTLRVITAMNDWLWQRGLEKTQRIVKNCITRHCHSFFHWHGTVREYSLHNNTTQIYCTYLSHPRQKIDPRPPVSSGKFYCIDFGRHYYFARRNEVFRTPQLIFLSLCYIHKYQIRFRSLSTLCLLLFLNKQTATAASMGTNPFRRVMRFLNWVRPTSNTT
jgi:hypothetical protein